MPFYNARDTMVKAIESIHRQTFPAWELLLIDNNSQDGSLSVAQEWQKKDERITIITEQQKGIAYALNTGLKHAKAGYICRMDADDWSKPQRLEKQFGFLEANKQIGVVAVQAEFSSALPGSEGYRLFVEWQNSLITPRDHYLNRFVESPVAHPAVMFRKSCYDLYGGYATGCLPEDYELWLRWMSKGVKFAKIPEKLLVWHDHAGRISRNHANYDQLAFEKVACHYLAQWVKLKLPEDKKIVICGTGKRSRRCAGLLETGGVNIYAFTNVVTKNISGRKFIPVTEIRKGFPYFFINFIAKRGVRESVRNFFISRNFTEGKDFIL